MNPMSLFLIGAGAIVVIGVISAAANKGLSGSRNDEADEAGEARRLLSGADASSTFLAGSAAAGLEPSLYAPDGSPLPGGDNSHSRVQDGDAANSSAAPNADPSGDSGSAAGSSSGSWDSGGSMDSGGGDFGGGSDAGSSGGSFD